MSTSPWGKLAGVRPSKVVHQLLDLGKTLPQITEHLLSYRQLRLDKANLLLDIAKHERAHIKAMDQHPEWVAIYVSIPFCPSRCSYCSFTSFSLKDTNDIRKTYFKTLKMEILQTAAKLKCFGKKVRVIYVGGGTPTSLSNDRFSELMLLLSNEVRSSETIEFTVEAGRPETINTTKLMAMKEAGVTRVSVNPQSMRSHTLNRIGRFHSPEQILVAAEKVKQWGFILNMDIIIGLPGEAVNDVEYTLDKVLSLTPHNVTVHALAIKRASEISLDHKTMELPPDHVAHNMADISKNLLAKSGYLTYYLYRQRDIVGELENIGYTLPGYDCLYNIIMIEERMSVFGCGAGAVSKILDDNRRFSRLANAKDPHMYIKRLSDSLEKKFKAVKQNG